jgi:hypothetical protein
VSTAALDTRDLGRLLARRVLQRDLDERVAKFYPAETLHQSWATYRATIARLGNPPDQIANFERARIVLQPKQLEFAAWARKLDTATPIAGVEQGAPELGMGGAKGPGKSFGVFTQMAVDDCRRYDGLKWLYLRMTGKRALEQIEDLIMAVLRYVDHRYTRGRVEFPNGSYILIGHFRTEKEAMNYAGIEYDGITNEEATQLRGRVHQALRQSARTSKIGWRPRLYNTTNPLGVGHKEYKQRFIDHERTYADVPDRTRKFIFATVDDNRAVNADYRGTLESLTGVERRAYLEGDWDVSAGAYFDQWRYDVHVVKAFTPPRQWRTWASMDYGFNHWNVIYLHAKSDDGVIYTFAELAHRKHYPEQIVPELRAVLAEYGLTLGLLDKFYAGSDVFSKTGAAKQSVAEQYKALGVSITAAQMGPGSRVAGAHHIARLLGQPDADPPSPPRWLVTENCKRLIETMPYLEADPNNPEDVLKVDTDDQGNGGDDPYDAVKYGLFTGGVQRLEAKVVSNVN